MRGAGFFNSRGCKEGFSAKIGPHIFHKLLLKRFKINSRTTIIGVTRSVKSTEIILSFNAVLVVMFEPAMYTVEEEAGHVTLTLSVEGDSVINNSIVIYTTSDTNNTAQGHMIIPPDHKAGSHD